MLSILITSKNSYIGNHFYDYIMNNYKNDYAIDKVSLREICINCIDFSKYDVVFHVAGIAHSDYGKISNDKEKEYYRINTDLTYELCKKAKENHVKQFIFMSSIIIYGDSAPINKEKIINQFTIPTPANAYGNSKLLAEKKIIELKDDNFTVSIIRSPMVYGNDCKGNYRLLEKISKCTLIFPYIENTRSVVNIENLCKYLKDVIEENESAIYFPQDTEYMNTSRTVANLAKKNGKRIFLIKGFTNIFKLLAIFLPFINKAFGNLVYEKKMHSVDIDLWKMNY